MSLQEVAGVLKRLDTEKREWDRECSRRQHQFFLPNGSKILVGSYTHLRREGLDGYMYDRFLQHGEGGVGSDWGYRD